MSQFGEYEVLKAYFDLVGVEAGYLVDIGAYQKEFSNTWGLLNEGWKGLLVDATPQNIENILNDFAGFDVQVVCAGVSDEDGLREMHLHEHTGHNSLLGDWYPVNKTGRTVFIQVKPLAALLTQMDAPREFDLLSIDTEGMDARIITKFFRESSYRPLVVVTESTSYEDAEAFYSSAGYQFMGVTGPADNPYTNSFFTRLALPPDDFYEKTSLRRPE
jgi:FkbM family methyltransferase